MRRFDVAIVGTGAVAALHAEALSGLAGRARVVAAVDVDEQRRTQFGTRFGVRRLHRDLDELLAAGPPDIVVLCTPPGLHAEQAITCLDRGITVLCEKPPALSLAELDRITAHTAADGPYFATVFQQRFGSGGLALAGLCRDGGFGRPTAAVCDTLWHRPDEYFALPWRGRWETEGGGPTMGHGIHQMDLMLAVLGPWSEVVAIAARQARPTATEDLSCALVTFENGTIATVANSLVSPRQTSYLRFDFTQATAELTHLYGYRDADWAVTGAPGHEERVGTLWTSRLTGVDSGHAAQFRHVLDALEASVPPPVTPADARSTMELVAAVYASAFTGRRVRRGEIGPGSPFYERMAGTGAPWPAPAEAVTGPGPVAGPG
ncbi:Gfo/Idh/MocA family protein [Catellatospora sichuanensis]|uniref:Gfo/Idh/MocA family protein n=1 Tax=Catellatospora sichuanensis TaxID=1969805 RepID=UPI0011843A65|nr:Gfo/Idh/MocA family oxidoreductase [Catellatospora sichuanensis]